MQGAWYGTYYTYHILHSDGVFDTTDPYGVASGIDSERSMVVNLAETDPAGWEQDERPERQRKMSVSVFHYVWLIKLENTIISH